MVKVWIYFSVNVFYKLLKVAVCSHWPIKNGLKRIVFILLRDDTKFFIGFCVNLSVSVSVSVLGSVNFTP